MVNNSGTVVFNAKFNANNATANPSTSVPAITANANDQGIMQWSAGTTTMLFHTGDTAVPGVPSATFRDLGFSNTQTRLNNLGHFAFAASMTNAPQSLRAQAATTLVTMKIVNRVPTRDSTMDETLVRFGTAIWKVSARYCA